MPSSTSFNSRSRVGSDFVRTIRKEVYNGFQFTLPCRERHMAKQIKADLERVSIHAPV